MPTTIDPLARLEAVDAALMERIPSAGGAFLHLEKLLNNSSSKASEG